ncbi:M9 family metallopeptidase [Pseudoduganella violacea]|uniref:microbial collagenase n=1 Tax=Pseudoduganella violacea TaxID=1715466 RepID=A0A7W5BAC0_9BURK|nr:M9 family metallopeptidase [Pseudoduganella violacea]MBB3119246.1 microbial collagenase [Pseudoduganella violacea]
MSFSRNTAFTAGLLTALLAGAAAQADTGVAHPHAHQERLKQAPMPHQRQTLPPSDEQSRYGLSVSKKPRNDLLPRNQRASAKSLAATEDCKDMNKLATYSGAALASYLVGLPDYECTYPLFSLTSAQAATIYSSANLNAVASRLASEAASYNAGNMAVVNLVLYLRAGYYLASGGTQPALPASLLAPLRASIRQLVQGNSLYQPNTVAPSTALEVFKLITNMNDTPYHVADVKGVVTRFTNRAGFPNAAEALKQESVSGALTGALIVLFTAHTAPGGAALLQSDLSYASTLNTFLLNNKTALLGSYAAFQLQDAANEAFRFLQYAALKSGVKPMVQNMLATTTMTGADSMLWLAAAQAVKYYDNASCSQYGTCNFEAQLANEVLKVNHACSPSLRLRAQEMTAAQVQEVCTALANEEGYVHAMLQTKRTPVAHDNNTALELVVFDDYSNYSKYAGIIYDIDTDNGGMYLEGNPAEAGNQARFIAHEASWLRPSFKVWNLEHEYVHYLDGRFNMYGDFGASTSVPTVWWIEGIAEYLSLRNNNQAAIDMARSRKYKLSEIFGNTYSMNDYVDRAYRWGYMAARFMMERHRGDVENVLARFRTGDYSRYQDLVRQIGSGYDSEFAAWADAATTAGEPQLPDELGALPTCSSASYLGKNCAIRNLSSSSRSYVFLMLPAGAKNVRVVSGGGSGDANLYLALDRYPTTASYDALSAGAGNAENIGIGSPAAGRWYYIMLDAKQPFSGLSVAALYD